MLKIKDGVDLKELEKFGFRYSAGDELDAERYDCFDDENGISVDVASSDAPYSFMPRYLYSSRNCYSANGVPNIVYDLIKAGLVEKGED